MIVADANWVFALADPQNAHHSQAEAGRAAMGKYTTVLLNPVTLAECLVVPARDGYLEAAAAQLHRSYRVPEVDRRAPNRWAALRVATRLKMPDVIVLDTALHHNARAVATFDQRLADAAHLHGVDVLSGDAG